MVHGLESPARSRDGAADLLNHPIKVPMSYAQEGTYAGRGSDRKS